VLLHDLLLEGLLYVIQLDEVCHHDGNTHTCLYPGALVAGSQALMLPCKEQPFLRFCTMNFTHRNYRLFKRRDRRTTYNANSLLSILIVLISCNITCFLLLKPTFFTYKVYTRNIQFSLLHVSVVMAAIFRDQHLKEG
jgi:hypothetical protein